MFVPARAALQQRLQVLGIPTAVHYPKPLHHQPAYAEHCCPDCCPNSVEAGEWVMSLPMSPDLTGVQMDRVVSALVDVLAG